LLRRTENAPHLLVPSARLCVEAVRSFVTDVGSKRMLDVPELWRALLQLLLKAAPSPARALWAGAKDREVEAVQLQVWRRGLVWLLGHPQVQDSNLPYPGPSSSSERAGPNDTEANTFWSSAISELTALAQEMAGARSVAATRLLLEAYRHLLYRIGQDQSAQDYAKEESSQEERGLGASSSSSSGTSDASHRQAAKAAAWSRVAVSMLNFLVPLVGRPVTTEEPDLQLLLLLRQTLLQGRVPALLASGPYGPFWARSVLEKLVSVLTGPVTAGAPLPLLRDAVSLVSKFFLQNLQTMQRHDCFGQLWLMVLRLMLQFIKRGSDDRDSELEVIATETLKNLLSVLVSSKVLGFVQPKAPSVEGQPVWWQMTWDCIEVFIPGFGEEFSKSVLGENAAAAGAHVPEQPQVQPPQPAETVAAAEAAPVVEAPPVVETAPVAENAPVVDAAPSADAPQETRHEDSECKEATEQT